MKTSESWIGFGRAAQYRGFQTWYRSHPPTLPIEEPWECFVVGRWCRRWLAVPVILCNLPFSFISAFIWFLVCLISLSLLVWVLVSLLLLFFGRKKTTDLLLVSIGWHVKRVWFTTCRFLCIGFLGPRFPFLPLLSLLLLLVCCHHCLSLPLLLQKLVSLLMQMLVSLRNLLGSLWFPFCELAGSSCEPLGWLGSDWIVLGCSTSSLSALSGCVTVCFVLFFLGFGFLLGVVGGFSVLWSPKGFASRVDSSPRTASASPSAQRAAGAFFEHPWQCGQSRSPVTIYVY